MACDNVKTNYKLKQGMGKIKHFKEKSSTAKALPPQITVIKTLDRVDKSKFKEITEESQNKRSNELIVRENKKNAQERIIAQAEEPTIKNVNTTIKIDKNKIKTVISECNNKEDAKKLFIIKTKDAGVELVGIDRGKNKSLSQHNVIFDENETKEIQGVNTVEQDKGNEEKVENKLDSKEKDDAGDDTDIIDPEDVAIKEEELQQDDNSSTIKTRDNTSQLKNKKQQRVKTLNKQLFVRREIERYIKGSMSRKKKQKSKHVDGKLRGKSFKESACQTLVECRENSSQTDENNTVTVQDAAIDVTANMDIILEEQLSASIIGNGNVNFGVGPQMKPYVVNSGAMTYSMGNNLDSVHTNINVLPSETAGFNMGYLKVDHVYGGAPIGVDEKTFYEYLRNCSGQDSAGNLLLHIEVMNNNLEEVRRQVLMLNLRNLSIDLTNSNNLTPLHLAVIHNCDESIVRFLLNKSADLACMDSDGNTAMHLAVFNNCVGILQVLLLKACEFGYNLNTFNYEGFTPLLLATVEDKYDMVKLFLDHGADANITDKKSGRTSLFHAVENNNLDMVKLLLAHGANKKIKNFSGTSTHDAVFELEGINPEIKNTIIGKDIFAINRTRVDKRKKTPQQKAACTKKLKTERTFRKIKL